MIVALAFGLSVVLLFAKAGLMRERATAGRVLVTNHIYSPAAADPQLQDQRRAAQISQRPVAVPTKAVIVREPSARTSTERPTPPERPKLRSTPVDPTKPFYVVAGTFEARENAEKDLARLQAKGLHQSFLGVFNDGKYTSVIARNFAQEDQARLMLAELKTKHNISGYIYHKGDE